MSKICYIKLLINSLTISKYSMSLKYGRFLDPKSDLVFKKIFGENKDLVKSFLNSLLPLDDHGLIDTIEYLTPEQVPAIPTMKRTIVDVKCKGVSLLLKCNWTGALVL
jgi:hypothetical protein